MGEEEGFFGLLGGEGAEGGGEVGGLGVVGVEEEGWVADGAELDGFDQPAGRVGIWGVGWGEPLAEALEAGVGGGF